LSQGQKVIAQANQICFPAWG